MNELVGKLTNLTYEIFGVLVPGIVMSMFIVTWWLAMGDVLCWLSRGRIPVLRLENLSAIASATSAIALAIPLLLVAYFLGHLLLWIGRSGPTLERGTSSKAALKRVRSCLGFRIPKPADSFDVQLEPLFRRVSPKFSVTNEPLEWRQFYPVAKSHLAQNIKYSLVAIYQNKYTLHRSLVTSAAVLFWMSVLGIIGGLASRRVANIDLNRTGIAGDSKL